MTASLLIENGRVIDGTGTPPVPRPRSSSRTEDRRDRSRRRRAGDASASRRQARRQGHDRHARPDRHALSSRLRRCRRRTRRSSIHRRNALSALVASYNARKLLRAGVTGILDPDSTFENMIDLRDAIDANIVQGPRMACGSYALITTVGGTAGRLINDEGVTGYYKVVKNKEEIVAEVRRQIKAGCDWIKVHVTGIIPRQAHKGELCVWTDEELKLICDTAHDLGTPVMGHCRGADATYARQRPGFDLIFHATGMDDRALEAVVERKIPISPALTFQANMVDFGASASAPTRRSSSCSSARSPTASKPCRRPTRPACRCSAAAKAASRMVPYGHWHYREMEVFVRYFGLTNLQAIQCGTQAGAIGLKMQGKIGRDRARAAGGHDLRRRRSFEGRHDPRRARSHQARDDRRPLDGSERTCPSATTFPGGGWRRWASLLTRDVAFSNRA